jgi:hypothetical protein
MRQIPAICVQSSVCGEYFFVQNYFSVRFKIYCDRVVFPLSSSTLVRVSVCFRPAFLVSILYSFEIVGY